MIDIARLKTILKRHEGLELKPYRCSADKLTIGVGRNIEDRGITMDEAEFMLNTDIALIMKEALQVLPFWNTLTPVRREVVLNMLFNLGMPRFLKFKKMLDALEKQDYTAAAFEMENSRWASQVGERAEELADMMRYNRYIS